jgi:hypothetical protein
VEPVGTTHGKPAQQSAVVLQFPPSGTHASPQMNGGSPAGLAVHGRPQQSALEAQASPMYSVGSAQSTGAYKHLGMPRLSCTQVGGTEVSELPAQQLVLALHDVNSSLQMAPAGLHELPLSQRPIGLLSSLLHWTFDVSPSGRVAEPQQSESWAQISPVGWQPLGGWQMKTPVGP